MSIVLPQNPLLDAALTYARRGWAVFPLHTPLPVNVAGMPPLCSCRKKDCDRVGKHPRTKNGLTDATTDEATIRSWWSSMPTANVGIRTGDGVVILDFDPPKMDDAAEALEHALPETPRALTGGGGQHYLFRVEREVRPSVGKLAAGVDVRGDGGYIVAPPSLHASGRPYEWDAGAHPDDIDLAPLPTDILARVAPAKKPAPPSTSTAADKFIEGGRNDALASLAGSMRRRGLSPEAIEAALMIENDARCVPALDPKEVQRIARSVGRYEPSAPVVAARANAGVGGLDRGDHVELAHATLAILEQGGLLTFDEGGFYRYDEATGVWLRLQHEYVTHAVSGWSGAPVGEKGRPLKLTEGAIRGVVLLMRNELMNVADRPQFARARRGVAFRNGFAVVEGGAVKLLPHAPEHMARSAFDFDFVPSAASPLLDDFFDVIFGDVGESERAARVMTLQEHAGATMLGMAPRYERALVLIGPGGNGKSAMLSILRGLFPRTSVASVPPQEWGERFSVARLVGVVANFVDEIPEREIASGERFKAIITGEPIHAERKNEHPFDFVPIAGHVFSANTLPATVDQTDGFWRRQLLVPFTRDLTKLPTRRAGVADEVLHAELPAVVAWALEGAARLERQNHYTVSETSQQMLEEWRDESDPVRMFLNTRPKHDRAAASELYESYVKWTRENGFAVMSSTKFGRRVMGTGLYERKDEKACRMYVRRVESNPPPTLHP